MAQFFISGINSYIGQALYEELRNDHIEEQSPNVFYGTLSAEEDLQDPQGVTKVLSRSKPNSYKKHLLESEFVVLDLHTSDLEEVASNLSLISGTESEKTLVVISNVCVWGDTPPKLLEISEDEPSYNFDLEVSRREVTVTVAEQEIEELDKDQFDQDEELQEPQEPQQPQEPQELQELQEPQEPQEEKHQQQEVHFEEASKVTIHQEKLRVKIAPFEDSDYKLRKAYPKYEGWKTIENQLLKIQNEKLKCYVVCAGLLYGNGEHLLFEHLRNAWLGQPLSYLPPGDNLVPTIHVQDLAKIVKFTLENHPPTPYILAIDSTPDKKQKSLVEAISSEMGSGTVQELNFQEAAFKDWAEFLSLNLWMVPSNIQTEFHCIEGIPQCMGKVEQEFNLYRGLGKYKVFITGPPAVGKSYFGRQVAEEYNLPLVQIAEVVEEVTNAENELAAKIKQELQEIKEKMIEEAEAKKKKNQELDHSKINPRIPDHLLGEAFRWKLNQNNCRNRGFVLDGWPRKYSDAKYLYLEDPEDEESQVVHSVYPEVVIQLNASNDFLTKRAKDLPEQLVAGTHYNDEGMKRRLAAYREANNEKTGPVLTDFFTKRNLEVLQLDYGEVDKKTTSVSNEEIIAKIQEHVEQNGKVENFLEEVTEEPKQETKSLEQDKSFLQEDTEVEEAPQEPKRGVKQEVEAFIELENLKAREKDFLEVKSQPYRHYLTQEVIPHLTEALFELVKTKPEDQLQFLADFLYKKSDQLK